MRIWSKLGFTACPSVSMIRGKLGNSSSFRPVVAGITARALICKDTFSKAQLYVPTPSKKESCPHKSLNFYMVEIRQVTCLNQMASCNPEITDLKQSVNFHQFT